MKLEFSCTTNFVYPSRNVARKAAELKKPYVFIFKKSGDYYLRFVDVEFTQQTQCGFIHQYSERLIFENLAPENQMIFYNMNLPYDKNNILTLQPTENEEEYKLCKD